MEKTVVIVADLEHFRAFVKKSDPLGREALEAITACDHIGAHGRFSQKVSDKAGNFKGASGEDHTLKTELKKRTVEQIAQEIESVLASNPHKEWWAAFPKAIFSQISGCLSPATQKKLTKELSADLTKMAPADILKHFLTPAQK